MPVTTQANISLIRFNEQGADPSTPAAGFSGIYMKADGLYSIDDDGNVTGPINNDAAVILAPGSSTRNIILPTAGDYIPLILRGYASAQTANLFEVKEGSAGTDVFTITGTGAVTFQNFTDSATGFRILDKDGGNTIFNVNTTEENIVIGGASVSANYDLGLINSGVLMLKETTTPTADTNYGKLYWKNDNKFYGQDGAGEEHVIHGFPTFKSYTVSTQGLGISPDIYAAGYYDFSTSDPGLDEGNLTQSIGAANLSHAAHAFIVTQGAGSVDTGVVGIKVTGISITDAGVRNAADEEVLLADITAAGTDTYYETTKKWLGAPVFTLYTVSGSPTTYNLALNYGLVKYEDYGNNDFTVTDIEAVGLAGANDSNFDITLMHHKSTGWTYNNGAFTPVIAANTIASLVGDHSTDDQLSNADHFAWKRSGLSVDVDGSNSEGVVILVSTSSVNAVEYCNLHVGVEF
jgi:hypothetical protein